ncbi:MAG TPA: autotransporter-associated beta strand repeat-containing protein, partial [Pirellulales bacterium]
DLYRLGAGASILYIGDPTSPTPANNVLTGAAGLIVGDTLTSGAASTVGNGYGTVVVVGDSNYTGATTINRSSTLEIRGATASSSFDVFGQLTLGGQASLTTDGNTNTAPVTLEPGSQLRFDSTNGVVTSAGGRWGDSAPIVLNDATLFTVGNANFDVIETVGAITSNLGQNTIQNALNIRGRIAGIAAASLTRQAGTALLIDPNTAGQLGDDERITLSGGVSGGTVTNLFNGATAVSITNGMLPAWMVDATDAQYVTYSDNGFVNVGWTQTQAAATLAATLGTGVERLDVTGSVTMGTHPINIYALGITANGAIINSGGGAGVLTIGSGGILLSNSVAATINGAAAGSSIVFGSTAAPSEADIYVGTGSTLTVGTLGTGGKIGTDATITANGLVKFGAGTLVLDSTQTFTGGISLDAGNLTLNNVGAGGSNTININNVASVLTLGTTATANANISVALGLNNPLATISVVPTTGTTAGSFLHGIQNLTFNAPDTTQGQQLTVTGSTTDSLLVNGITTINGTAWINTSTAGTSTILAGGITGTGVLNKEGAPGTTTILYLGTNTAATNPTGTYDFSGPINVVEGIMQASAVAAVNGAASIDTLGAGNTVTLYGNTQLNLRMDQATGATVSTGTLDNNIVLAGNATINVDRVDAVASTTKIIALDSLSIGTQTLTVNGADTYGLQFNNVTLTGQATITNSESVVLNNVSDGGAGLTLTKNSTGDLWVGTGNTFSGGIIVNQGGLRFGGANLAESSTATAGTGPITINPGATIRISGQQNIVVGQTVTINSTATFMSDIDLRGGAAGLTNLSFITPGSSGVLSIGATTYANPLDMSTIGNGTFYLGANGTGHYTASTLGVGAGNVFRLGGEAGLLDLGLSATAVPGGLLTGNASVIIGSLATNGTGSVEPQSVSSFTGSLVISRGSTYVPIVAPTATGTSIGGSQVDVFGTLELADAATTQNFANTANAQTIVMHPGSILEFTSRTVVNSDVWNDNTPLALNGGTFIYNADNSAVAQSETMGELSFAYGSTIQIERTNAGATATIISSFGDNPRPAGATLEFNNDVGQLGSVSATGTDHLILTSGAPARGTSDGATINMIAAWYVSVSDSSFLDYNPTTGFTTLGQAGTGAAGYTTSDGGANSTFLTGLTNGQAIVDVTTQAQSLADNPIVYALRTSQNITNGAGSAPGVITIRGSDTGDTGGGLIITGTTTIQPDLVFANNNGPVEALIYNSGTTTLSGDLSASTITKFGAGTLNIGKDQPNYTGGWTVNQGQLTPNTAGALGQAVSSNVITLNANAQLNLTVSPGIETTIAYGGGPIVVNDIAVINNSSGVGDRISTIALDGGITVNNSSGDLEDAQLKIDVQTRQYLETGPLTLNGDTQVNVANSSQVNGGTAGLQVNGIVGTGVNLDKWGNGYLYINGPSSSFTGTVNIQQGAVQVNDLAGFGAGNTVNVSQYGILDVAVPQINNANVTINYTSGGIERWSIDNARTGTFDLGAGTIQVNADQSGSAGNLQVNVNGGSIEGFLPTDSLVPLVYRSVAASVSFNVGPQGMLVGQALTAGVNGLDDGLA